MNTIYAYGDSYIASYQDNKPGWASILAKKLNKNLINRGVSGGSTENAMLNFVNDLKKFNDGDIVLFQLSIPGRLHFNFQTQRPETGSVYYHGVEPGDPRHVWYYENKQHIQWYIKNYNQTIAVINHNAYIHEVRNFAENNPLVTVVLLQNTSLLYQVELPASRDNFIIVPIDLDKISKNEFVRPFEYREWTKFTKYDVRINHLSNPNLVTLSNLVAESLETRCTDNFSYDKFEQKIVDIIVSKDDHDRYVQLGLLYDMSHMFNEGK